MLYLLLQLLVLLCRLLELEVYYLLEVRVLWREGQGKGLGGGARELGGGARELGGGARELVGGARGLGRSGGRGWVVIVEAISFF